ncbi:ATP-binding protein [Rhodohalobacter sp. SW132]|uniref:ATP-binding protein n=1 Tax=Rhodohalobacter sp. SW132 TaxID=2293433 RepID=UPI000E235BD8|nr:ATP-binding protein [Rhodohalobacter sp. SW132]REL24865.1 ATP-binding protein [Rhodohalobacter sp. SW132]
MSTISTYQKSIVASTKNLAEARNFVADHAGNHGFTKQQIADIRLVVDEAITNIIKHAYRGDDKKSIDIEISFEKDMICIQIQDTGKSFKMNRYSEPDIERKIKEKKRGGMGLYLIHSLMDEVSYSNKNGTNEMIMCKYRS